MSKAKWHKPTDQEKLDEAHEHFHLPKKKRKYLNWWDKVKISLYEDRTDAEIIEQKLLPQTKDKEELIDKFEPICDYGVGYIYQQRENAKACAIICVEEILNQDTPLGMEMRGWWLSVKKSIKEKDI